MTRVVVESPLNAPTREGIEENKKYARRCIVDCIQRGEAPYASHLLFDHPDILDDLRPEERVLGMTIGFTWGSQAEKIVVYTDRGVSKGMQAGIDHYIHKSIPIEYRRLD